MLQWDEWRIHVAVVEVWTKAFSNGRILKGEGNMVVLCKQLFPLINCHMCSVSRARFSRGLDFGQVT